MVFDEPPMTKFGSHAGRLSCEPEPSTVPVVNGGSSVVPGVAGDEESLEDF